MEEINNNLENVGRFSELERELLSGRMSNSDFIEKVLEVDQSEPSRQSALEAVVLLSKPNIVELYINSPERITFYSVRSLSYFHKAQIRLSFGEVGVEDDLVQALRDAEEVDDEVSKDWQDYIKATIFYLRNDLNRLKEVAENITSNKSLVRNFVRGLEERGRPDYMLDYSKPREDNR